MASNGNLRTINGIATCTENKLLNVEEKKPSWYRRLKGSAQWSYATTKHRLRIASC